VASACIAAIDTERDMEQSLIPFYLI